MELEKQFTEVIQLIKKARYKALKTVNTELINLYWQVGEYISKRIAAEQWGKSVVLKLAKYIEKREPDLKGFSDKNLWRMKQLYEAYKDFPELAPLVREISWTHNLIILSGAKSIAEKEFYLKLCIQEGYGKRELERQITSSLFERAMLGNQKLSPSGERIEGKWNPYF